MVSVSIPADVLAPVLRYKNLGNALGIIIGFMVFLASLTLSAETSLYELADNWTASQNLRLTVLIPHVNEDSQAPQANRVVQAVSILRALPEVAMVMPVPDDEAQRLLRPWFTDTAQLSALPLPSLIDIEAKPGFTISAEALQARLRSTIADAQVDDGSVWRSSWQNLLRIMTMIALAIVTLAAVSLGLVITLVCRMIIATARDTVILLSTIGAPDEMVAREIQRQAMRQAWPPAVTGALLAVIIACAALQALRGFALHNETMSVLSSLRQALPIVFISISTALAALLIIVITARRMTHRLLSDLP